MTAKWTFMVYLAGNNSLSEDAGADLAEMRRVGSSEAVRVLAFVKRERVNAQRLVVEKGQREGVEDLGPGVDSGDPQTVVDFVRWAVRKAPAQRYALVLWNHGGGWRAADLEQLYAGVREAGPTRRETNKRAGQKVGRSIFTTTAREILAQPEDNREILADDTSQHSLDTIELQRVVHEADATIGHTVDLLGMDACLMTAVEVVYQLRNDAAAIVGSEEEEPAAGWPYAAILRDIAANPEMSGSDLAKDVVQRYVESYRGTRETVTQSAFEPGKLDGLVAAVDALERALRPQLARGWRNVLTAQARSAHFAFDLVDLKTFCAKLAASEVDAAVRSAATNVVNALRPGGVVIAEGHRGKKVEECAGMSVYFPAPTTPISKYYKDLAFAKRHRWDELLRAYQDAVAAS